MGRLVGVMFIFSVIGIFLYGGLKFVYDITLGGIVEKYKRYKRSKAMEELMSDLEDIGFFQLHDKHFENAAVSYLISERSKLHSFFWGINKHKLKIVEINVPGYGYVLYNTVNNNSIGFHWLGPVN